ncbi:hypothetical protein [Pseudoalteromonas piscicida]
MKTSSLTSLILLSFCGFSLANANALYDITERDAFSVTSDVKEQIQGEGIEQFVDRFILLLIIGTFPFVFLPNALLVLLREK